jgi:hypothetical protein
MTESESESDLPDPTSGETFTDLDSLTESIREGAPDADAGDSDSEGAEEGQIPEDESGESGDSQSGTVRMTFHVDRETAERLRNAIYWTATPITLSGTARDALRAAVRQLEEQHNDGEPFPDRDAELKGGNPNLKA